MTEDVQIQLAGIRALLATLLDNVSPQMRFCEVRVFLGHKSINATRAWLNKRNIKPVSRGRFRRADVVLAATQAEGAK